MLILTRKKMDMRTELEKKAKEHYFQMSDNTNVKVLEFNIAKKPDEYILFYIPGFGTVFQSWHESIEHLSKEFKIYYFESREKASSIMPNKKTERNITLHKMAYDIKGVIEQLELDEKNYVTICSSTGGTIEIEALSEKWLNPKGAIMVGPTVEYHVRVIVAIFISLVPEFMKKMVMPIVRWYLGKVYVNKKENPEQFIKYMRAVEEMKVRKIRKPIWQMVKYKCWHMLPKIQTKCLIIGESGDKMHVDEETIRTSKLIPNAEYINLGSNKAAHSLPLVNTVKDFIKKLKKG